MIKTIKKKLFKVYVDITHIHQESDCESQQWWQYKACCI